MSLNRPHTEEEKRKMSETAKERGFGVWTKGKTAWNKGKTLPKGEKSSNWKGNLVKYSGLHMWVRRNFGKKFECESCGIKDENRTIKKRTYLHWANLDRKYTRKRESWAVLCYKCHKKYDATHR